MRHYTIICAIGALASGVAGAQTVVGGPGAAKDVTLTSNWITNDTALDDATNNQGLSFNWENVTTNSSVANGDGVTWDWTGLSAPNHVIGKGYIYDQAVDLSTLPATGITSVAWTADFSSDGNTNWYPIMEHDDGAGTVTYYAWSGNDNARQWRGSEVIDFAVKGSLANPENWAKIRGLTTDSKLAGAFDGSINPPISASTIVDYDTTTGWVLDGSVSGTVRFGFFQWGASTGGSANFTRTMGVEAFEVTLESTVSLPPNPDAYIGGGTANGTPDVTDVTLWTTNNLPYMQNATVGVDNGYQLNYENVFQNSSVANGTTNVFDQDWEAAQNYNIARLFIWEQESVDLSTLPAGITGLGFKASMNASFLNNWHPVMAITKDGVTTYYRDSSGATNPFNGTGTQVFSDWTRLAQPSDWNGLKDDAEIAGVMGGFNESRDSEIQPHLRPTYEWNFDTKMYDLTAGPTGTATFGFLQWGGSTGGDIDPPVVDQTLAINSFEVIVYSDNSLIVEPPAPQGLSGTLASDSFLYKYEMDVSPAAQDLDGVGLLEDWRPHVFDPNFNIPQTYTDGVAFSNQNPSAPAPDFESIMISRSGDDAILDWVLSAPAAVDIEGTDDLDLGFSFLGTVESGITTFVDQEVGTFADRYFYQLIPLATIGVPENLFRNDDDGSIFRESLVGSDFTMEVRARVIGPKDAGDVGILGIAVDPGGAASALRMQVDLEEVSQNGGGASAVPTSANDDAMHVYRVAYVYADDYFFVWRDGELIYGDNTDIGIQGSNGGFSDAGTTWVGDFSGSLSGEWEVDYIRLHNTAVAPE